MFKTRNVTANATPVQLTFENPPYLTYSIIITNTSANKHLLVGDSNVSTTNYGFRVEHDQPPMTIESIPWTDHFWAVSEDGSTIPVAVTIIERI